MTDPDYKSITVLVIDDERFTRRLLVQILAQIGVGTIIEATEGTEGLVAVADHQPHLILCDIAMQPMDGVTFLRELRQGGMNGSLKVENPEVPVIFLSAHGTAAAVKEGMLLGVDSVIAKPPSLAIIKRRIDFILRGRA